MSSFRRCAGWWAAPVVRTVVFGSLGLAPVHSYAAVFKCINQAGRVAYQSAACELSAAQSSVKIDPPPPSGPGSAPGGGAVVARTGAADAAAQQQEAANAAIHATAIRATWQRLGRAFDNGDIEAALRELTPAAQDKYRPVFALVRKNLPSFRFAQLGTMHSIKVIDGVAEIKIVRDKPGGPFGYVTSLVQTTDGRWLISGM